VWATVLRSGVLGGTENARAIVEWHTDLELVRIQVDPDDPLGATHLGPLCYLQFVQGSPS
jgi:hypothetical protein